MAFAIRRPTPPLPPLNGTNFQTFFYPTFFLLQLNPTYMKRILHFKNITFKSSYNWFKIDIHQQLRPLTANYFTTASRPTKVYGWKFTHHGWISNHYLENQPLVGKPTTLWLEILPPSQPHRYHNSALYILFDKGKVEENSTS